MVMDSTSVPIIQDNAPYLVAGLGNPGREYRSSRHNIGFMLIDVLSKDLSVNLTRVQSRAVVGGGFYTGNRVFLAKPVTYMNLSGQAVGALIKYYKIPLDHLLVVNDDLDLPLGTLRLRPGGGSAGQKGMASIIERLGTQEFPRLRLGIGRPPGRMEPADYVLQEFTKVEQALLQQVLDRARMAVCTFITGGLTKAMNDFNGSLDKE
jgi:PTH1 family peptidyl-tRNA hydrolase